MSKKDSYWFKHDSSAGRGLRMRKMAHIYGHWGKGIYWDVIEILRDQSSYCFDSDDSSLQMLCDLIGCKDESRFLNWFKDCIRFDLFKIVEKKFLSEVLCENMKGWEKAKDDGGKGGNPKFKKGLPNPYYLKDNLKDKGIDNPSDKGKDKHKRREENSIDKYIIRIGINETYNKPPSQILENEYRQRFETILMTKLKGINREQLLKEFDKEYPFYDFSGANHLLNAVGLVGKKIMQQNAQNKETVKEKSPFKMKP